ncbi:Tyrosine-protein phosphatase CpsB [Clostridiales bacterium CHKCI006]|nr:Tyrosine-protein phosphatase CpsB [Clostridiales bacterium CHKCI006]
MPPFIDTHGHYAWQIDDGMPSIIEAKQALALARSQHIEAIIATPHLLPGIDGPEVLKKDLARIAELKNLAKMYHIDIYPGSEIMLHSANIGQSLIPMADSHYLLCEFDVRKGIQPHEHHFEDWLYEVILLGYTPIIAHAERYFHQGIDCDRIAACIQMGCYVQVNSTSFLYKHVPVFQKNAYTLLEHNLVHLIASDTHRATAPRCPNLADCWQKLVQHYPAKELEKLFYANPLAIIQDRTLQPTTLARPSRLKQWFFFLRRRST